MEDHGPEGVAGRAIGFPIGAPSEEVVPAHGAAQPAFSAGFCSEAEDLDGQAARSGARPVLPGAGPRSAGRATPARHLLPRREAAQG
eukprot:1757496-Lingulodinium_polyedra.AAC.1